PGRSGLLGEIAQFESTARSIYFVVAGAGATASLCCAQAPSPKAVTRTAIIMIIFRNFNLSRLLSSQVAPVRLGGEPSRSNTFLNFFWPPQIWLGQSILRSLWCLPWWSLLPSIVVHKFPNPTAF